MIRVSVLYPRTGGNGKPGTLPSFHGETATRGAARGISEVAHNAATR